MEKQKSYIKTINLEYQLQNGIINSKYLIDCVLHQVCQKTPLKLKCLSLKFYLSFFFKTSENIKLTYLQLKCINTDS